MLHLLGFNVSCAGENWQGLSRCLTTTLAAVVSAPSTAALARAVLPMAAHLSVRMAGTAAHQDALARARVELRKSPMFPQVQEEVGSAHAEAVTILLYAISDRLAPSQCDELGVLTGAITEEIAHLRAQLAALYSTQIVDATGAS